MTGEVQGYFGCSRPTPCTIFIYKKRNGLTWYAVEGSTNINATYDEVVDGINVEGMHDVDTITADAPVNSEEDLEREVDE